MCEKTCSSCYYFVQHYIRMERRFVKIVMGHCIRARVKKIKSNTKICDYYKEKKRR